MDDLHLDIMSQQEPSAPGISQNIQELWVLNSGLYSNRASTVLAKNIGEKPDVLTIQLLSHSYRNMRHTVSDLHSSEIDAQSLSGYFNSCRDTSQASAAAEESSEEFSNTPVASTK